MQAAIGEMPAIPTSLKKTRGRIIKLIEAQLVEWKTVSIPRKAR